MTIPDVNLLSMSPPDGEKADPRTIALKVQGMFLEMMIKTMEDSISAEDGLFGQSASSEIYRGMLREKLGAAMSSQLATSFVDQLENGIQSGVPAPQRKEEPNDSSPLPVSGAVTSPVGWRQDPISGGLRFHKGTDIAAAYGTEVKSVADGVVVESSFKGSYGNTVVVEATDGRRMLYAHNSANLVQVGDRVRRGDVIAQVGTTGRATGPHVHFEVLPK